MPDSTQALVSDLIAKLRRRKIEGSHATARLTAKVLRVVISNFKEPHKDRAAALIEAVRNVGKQLIAANPMELAVGNIVRRVLHIIREEDLSLVTDAIRGLKISAEGDDQDIVEWRNNENQSANRCLLHAVFDRLPDSVTASQMSASWDNFKRKGNSADNSTKNSRLKFEVIKAVDELIDDIDTCHEQIAEQAVELIHQNEVILTLGRSKLVKEFLCAAIQKKRSFHIFIAEGAPKFEGHVVAKELAKRGLKTTVITDSAVFAMISRVNMVITGIHAVMANGSIIAPVGLNMVALAARRHAVPFVVVAGTHELCPLYPQNPEVLLNELRSPFELLDFEEFSDAMDYGVGSNAPLLHVVNPAIDFVAPELVNLFVTNRGGYNPSHIYRLIADYYSSDDLTLQQKSAS